MSAQGVSKDIGLEKVPGLGSVEVSCTLHKG